MNQIIIKSTKPELNIEVEFLDNPCAKKIQESLPIESQMQTWGDEIYFPIPMKMQEDNAHATVPSGTIAFWPPGSAFCIFFGQTPASPVNVMGKLDGDPKLFKNVRDGETVNLERASEE